MAPPYRDAMKMLQTISVVHRHLMTQQTPVKAFNWRLIIMSTGQMGHSFSEIVETFPFYRSPRCHECDGNNWLKVSTPSGRSRSLILSDRHQGWFAGIKNDTGTAHIQAGHLNKAEHIWEQMYHLSAPVNTWFTASHEVANWILEEWQHVALSVG